MRRLVLALAVVSCATEVRADLILLVESDWTAYLVNDGDAPVHLNGYHLHSDSPIFSPATWLSIEDQVAADRGGMIAAFGAEIVKFGEANPHDTSLAELALLAFGVFEPGERLSLGQPFLTGVDPNLVFEYADVTDGFANFRVVQGEVRNHTSVAPEPAAWILALTAVVACRLLRRALRRQPA